MQFVNNIFRPKGLKISFKITFTENIFPTDWVPWVPYYYFNNWISVGFSVKGGGRKEVIWEVLINAFIMSCSLVQYLCHIFRSPKVSISKYPNADNLK